MTKRTFILLFCILVGSNEAVAVSGGEDLDCGELTNPYGPYDFTDPAHREEFLPVVEKFHFTKNVEALIRGKSDTITGDLHYTLRAFPNHHRALDSMARYQFQHKRPFGAPYYSAECYFVRAIRFKPYDGVVRLIYGIFFHKRGDFQSAEVRYLEALKLVPEASSAEVFYNLGLLYIDLKMWGKAIEFAQKAYDGGHPLPGLKNRLKRAGKWP